MKTNLAPSLLALTLTASLLPAAARAQLIISEVDPTGSSASYGADWFELKNIGASAVDITGWKMDDSSASFGSAVALRGLTSIAPGLSVIFLEGNATGTTDATIDANFISAWFGGSAPVGLTLANYGGAGVGLSASGDAVNIYNGAGVLQAGITFGTSTTGISFDNAAGLSGTISQLSVAGVNGAFVSFNGLETGSPGDVTPAPEPSSLGLIGLGLTGLFGLRRRQSRPA